MADFTSVFFALAFVWVCKGVIVCNGDFEGYGLVPDGNGQALQMEFSDPSCWYDSNYGFMFARIVNSGTSTTMEFTTGFPYILCQDVLLDVGNTYQLNFSVYNQQEVLSSNTRVSINYVQVYDHLALNSLNFTSASFNFVADSAYTQVCFDLAFTLNIASGTIGPCIDNITIVDITPPIVPPSNTTNTTNTTNNTTNTTNATTNTTSALNSTTNTTGSINSTTNTSTFNYSQVLSTTNSSNFNSTFNSTSPLLNTTNSTNTTNNSVYNTTNSTLNVTAALNNTNTTGQNNFTLNNTMGNVTNLTNIINFNGTNSSNFNSPSNNNGKLKSKFELDDMVTWTVSCIISYPVKLIAPLKDAYMFIDDLWLYDYNERNFTDMQETLFSTIAKIQLLKFEYLEKFLGWNKVKSFIKISDYRPFSAPRFVNVEGTSSVLIDSNFAFLIYTAPQNILFSLALFLLFHLLKDHKVSKFIRKFYFIKTTLVLVLWESNFTYFLYICFSHLRHPFCFNFADKVSAAFTVVFLCSLLLFSFCFYLLISKYLGKKAGHFSEVTYRESAGFWYKTLQLSIRNLLRAVVFCFFHYNYTYQLTLLSLVECFVIVFSLFLESKYKIFLSKATFSLNLSYPFLIIVWNTVLLMQANYSSESSIFLLLTQFQEAILYCLICNVLLMILRDFLPVKCSDKEPKQKTPKQPTLTHMTHKSSEHTVLNKSKTKVQFLSVENQLPIKKQKQSKPTILPEKNENSLLKILQYKNGLFEQKSTKIKTKVQARKKEGQKI